MKKMIIKRVGVIVAGVAVRLICSKMADKVLDKVENKINRI